MDRTAIGFFQKMLLAFLAVISLAGSESIIEEKLIVGQDNRGLDLSGYTIATYAYTAIGWNLTEIDFGIVEKNLDYVKTAPKPYNASASDRIDLVPEHAFVTTEILKNRDLARLLSQTVPEPDPLTVPCIINSKLPDDLVVTRLSCLARDRYSFYVTGLLEKVACEGALDCREDGLKIFSTTVVFGKNGQIIAKYRKFNMVDEPALDAASTQEIVTFQTESNVTMGLLAGHDLLFNEPAHSLLQKGVKNFLLNGAWKNKMPFTIATSIQAGWAQANKVNLMSSNYMRAELGYTGNGFYKNADANIFLSNTIGIQNGSGGYIYSVTGVDDLKSNRNLDDGKRQAKSIVMASQDLSGWTSIPVPPSNSQPSEVKVCHGEEFCCILTYRTIRSAENPHFQGRALYGTSRHLSTDQGSPDNIPPRLTWACSFPEQTCGLVACSGDDVTTCNTNKDAVLYTNDISFSVLKLSGLFSSNKVAPVSMQGNENFFPISFLNFTTISQGDRYNVTYEYNKAGFEPIHSFALTSTDYRIPASGVDRVTMAPLIILITLVLQKMI